MDVRGHALRKKLGQKTVVVLTLTALLMALGGWLLSWSNHPSVRVREPLILTPFAPGAEGTQANDWLTLPFFYSMGAWPKRFGDRTILYGFPYEKGPPQRFPGKIVARWKMPDLSVTIEGPKTPIGVQESTTADEIKECFSQAGVRFGCMGLRRQILSRHVMELSHLNPSKSESRWLEISAGNAPATILARGIYLRAENSERVAERIILITPSGSHQSFTLERNIDDPQGSYARDLFEKSIRSLQASNELGSGRALVDQQLERVRLGQPKDLGDPVGAVQTLAEIQALLLAKISVSGNTVDPYYHLGGTALMILRNAAELRTRRSQLLDGRLLNQIDEWSASAKPMVQSAYLYAQDVGPQDANTLRLQNLWAEAQKF